ncbi:MAG: hypothetical protein AAF632_14775 [Bacteroidota bacterium]
MKIFKSKNSVNTGPRWAWTTMLLIGAIAIGMFSCNEDEDSDLTPDPGDGQEAESGWLHAYWVQQPNGTRPFYVQVDERLPAKVDLSAAVELGVGVAPIPSDDGFFTINTNASTISKWEVDKSTFELSVSSAFSYASTGAQPVSLPIFLSDDQGFITDLQEGIVVEFNPEIMEITKIHSVEPVTPASGEGYRVRLFDGDVLDNGKIFHSIEYTVEGVCCEFPFQEPTPYLAIFDPTTGQVEYKTDPRLPIGGRFTTVDADGFNYISPNEYTAVNRHYFNLNGMDGFDKYFLFRLDGNGNIDEGYTYDLTSILDIDYGGQVNAVQGDEFLVTYNDIDEWPEAYDDRWNWWGDPEFSRISVVNSSTNDVKPFTGLSNFSLGGYYIGTVEGFNYWSAAGENSGALVRQVSFDNFEVVTEVPSGSNMSIIGKLW